MTNRLLAVATSAASLMWSSPVFAQVQYEVYYQTRPIPPLLLVLAILALSVLLFAYALNGLFSSESSSGPCNCPECTGARYEQQAELMRQITREQDAHTAMMRSEIRHAQTHGEYRERQDIVAHEQRVRELLGRLESRRKP
jgi:hypothetical protein